jgi:formate dehydrogenase iron-sulfur subunit
MTAVMPDPAATAGWLGHPDRVGFFTDTSICIGCKACEVACKQWNGVPEDGLNFLAMSYDNTGQLDANNWRHVAFIEQRRPAPPAGPTDDAAGRGGNGAGRGGIGAGPDGTGAGPEGVAAGPDGNGSGGIRWLMSSDVCKHCTSAACLDVCPTGALMRTEFGTVVVQQDVCNGCGYCVPACPFGVIDQRRGDGRVWKCTMCYDRLKGGLEPACAQACPTKSIQFGPLDELRARAGERVGVLQAAGVTEARLYGADPSDGVEGFGAFFLLLDDPAVYGLPPAPRSSSRHLPAMWKAAAAASLALTFGVVSAVLGGRR